MNNLYCTITGGHATMKLKLFLKLLFFVILAGVKILFGMDWALIVAAVIVVSDLDEIVDSLNKKLKRDCD